MNKYKKNHCWIVTAIFTAFFLITVQSASAAAVTRINPALLQQVLNAFETASSKTLLFDGLKPVKALRFTGSRGTSVAIGFPGGAVSLDRPFPLHIDGVALSAVFSSESGLSIIGGNNEFTNQGVFDILDCVFDALFYLPVMIGECRGDPGCIIESLLLFGLNMSLCPINML
ncbi:MAG: hypothetical protein GY868_19810 [Deltaproteobacteria bacterium]|nr:hypothetical protein [Deltaproteobacteria bacterium]